MVLLFSLSMLTSNFNDFKLKVPFKIIFNYEILLYHHVLGFLKEKQLFKFVIFSEACSTHIIFLLILIWRTHLTKVTNKYSNFKFTNTKYFFIKANCFLSRQKLSGHPYTVLPAQSTACHSPVGLCLCFMLL